MTLLSERQSLSLLSGLLGFVAGVLLGGVVNALVERYAVFKESKGAAVALQAEIRALLALVTFRNYVGITDAIIARLNDPTHVLNAADVFSVQITQDYFSVFHALSPKIGLLGPLSSNVVLAYAATKSLFEDIARLREESRPFTEGTRTALADQLRADLLRVTVQINQLLREVITVATNANNALGAYADRRWFRVFT